jgi:hypothetical protein
MLWKGRSRENAIEELATFRFFLDDVEIMTILQSVTCVGVGSKMVKLSHQQNHQSQKN